ncbi:MAG: hypothetical protein V4465_02920 [Patescibacteria group bacterium]
MKKSFVVTLVILIALIILGYAFWDSLFPFMSRPNPLPVTETTRVMPIEDYIRLNISGLSTVKETVGGKFYVTSIEAHGGAGTVSYEDGHNGYTADFTYNTDAVGAITITSWNLR